MMHILQTLKTSRTRSIQKCFFPFPQHASYIPLSFAGTGCDGGAVRVRDTLLWTHSRTCGWQSCLPGVSLAAETHQEDVAPAGI